MSEETRREEMVLRFVPPGGAHEVPAALLAKALEGFQGFVHVFAFQEEGKTLKQRFKVPADIAERYTLNCRPPEEGSFAIAIAVSPAQPDLVAEENVRAVQDQITKSLKAIDDGDQKRFAELLPDSRLRLKAISFLRSAIPPAGSGYRLGVMNGAGAEIPVRSDRLRMVDAQKVEEEFVPGRDTVTGKLTAISFDDRKVTIYYAPTSRELECVYSEDLEPMLFENRRDLIQVTGQVMRNAHGEPEKIVEVEAIEELDLSPMRLDELTLANERNLKVRPPLFLKPDFSEEDQLLSIEHVELQIDVFAPTREILWKELQEQVAMLWIEYVEAPESELSPPALELRNRLRDKMEVTANAP